MSFVCAFSNLALSLLETEFRTTSTINITIHGNISQINLHQSTHFGGNRAKKFVVVGTKHDQRLHISQLLGNGAHDPGISFQKQVFLYPRHVADSIVSV
jgi:hypothetical protein